MSPQALIFAASLLPMMVLTIVGPLMAADWLRRRRGPSLALQQREETCQGAEFGLAR